MTNRSASIIPHLREHKPRAIPTHQLVPSHPISAAPCAIPQPLPAAVPHVSQPSEHVLTTPPHSTSPHEQQSPPSRRPVTTNIQPDLSVTPSFVTKTRKRFRKKANGLFGDQTELKKRMSKLIIKADKPKLVQNPVSASNSLHSQRPFQFLPAAKTIIKHLTATMSPLSQDQNANCEKSAESNDSLRFIMLDDTASGPMGSLEKIDVLRNTMGKLTPRSNEKFLSILGLGKSSHDRKKPYSQHQAYIIGQRITPPFRPLPRPEKGQQQWATLDNNNSSTKNVDRTGLPAVLRCKTRRLDRGYRRADVLRARFQWSTGTEVTTAPSSGTSAQALHDTLPGGTRSTPTKRTRRRKLPGWNKDEEKASLNDGDVLLQVEAQYQEQNSLERAQDINRQEMSPNVRKRQRASLIENSTDTESEENCEGESNHWENFDTYRHTKRIRPSRPDSEKRRSDNVPEAHNALTILVEAATGRTPMHREAKHSKEPTGIEKSQHGSELDTYAIQERHEQSQTSKRHQLPRNSHRKRACDTHNERHTRSWQGEELSENAKDVNNYREKRRRKQR